MGLIYCCHLLLVHRLLRDILILSLNWRLILNWRGLNHHSLNYPKNIKDKLITKENIQNYLSLGWKVIVSEFVDRRLIRFRGIEFGIVWMFSIGVLRFKYSLCIESLRLCRRNFKVNILQVFVLEHTTLL